MKPHILTRILSIYVLQYGSSSQAYRRHISKNCLMLLGSPPDMFHNLVLRRAWLSTLHIKRLLYQKYPYKAFSPAIADCRYRVPLVPRIVWFHTMPQYYTFILITFNFGNKVREYYARLF